MRRPDAGRASESRRSDAWTCPAVDVDADALLARHGLSGPVVPLPGGGIFNTVHAVGTDLVLRVPRDHPFFVATARKEVLAVPAARAAGVRTPAIVLADDSCELVPVPYAIYERVEGETLERAAADPAEHPEVWRELGRDLARLHDAVADDGPLAGLETEDLPDTRNLLEGSARAGHLSVVEERWLARWLDELDAAAGLPARRFLHGDTQASNVIVQVGDSRLRFAAVLDWGGCGWGDPAHDFAGIPLRAVPALLAGYDAERGEEVGEAFRARIVRRHLQLALFNLTRGPQPGRSWAERPASMLIDVLRFFVAAPPAWTPAGPPVRLDAGPGGTV